MADRVIEEAETLPESSASKSDSPSLFTVISTVTSPGSALGRYIGESGMSDESIYLVDNMRSIRESATGKGVRECVAQVIGHKIAGDYGGAYDGECTPTLAGTIEEAGAEVSSRIIGLVEGTAGSALSVAFNTFSTVLEFENNHKAAIEALSKNGFPGMHYNEETIDGIRVRTWADAIGAGLYPDDPQIKTYVSYESRSGDSELAEEFRSNEWRTLQKMEERTANQAIESAYEFIAENSYEAFQEKLHDAPKIMREQHMEDVIETAAFRQSIRAAPEDRQSSFDTMTP